MRTKEWIGAGVAILGLALVGCGASSDTQVSTTGPSSFDDVAGASSLPLPVDVVSIPAAPASEEVRVVLKRPRCGLAAPEGKHGAWRIDTPFPGAPASIRRSFCSYLWIPAEEGASPEFERLELTRAEERVISLATLHCELGECKAPEIDTEELGSARSAGPAPRGGGGGCPACGSANRTHSYFIYLHHPIPGERVALLRRSPLGTAEDLGTITVPQNQAFAVRYRARAILAHESDAAAAPEAVCLAPIQGDARPTSCPVDF